MPYSQSHSQIISQADRCLKDALDKNKLQEDLLLQKANQLDSYLQDTYANMYQLVKSNHWPKMRDTSIIDTLIGGVKTWKSAFVDKPEWKYVYDMYDVLEKHLARALILSLPSVVEQLTTPTQDGQTKKRKSYKKNRPNENKEADKNIIDNDISITSSSLTDSKDSMDSSTPVKKLKSDKSDKREKKLSRKDLPDDFEVQVKLLVNYKDGGKVRVQYIQVEKKGDRDHRVKNPTELVIFKSKKSGRKGDEIIIDELCQPAKCQSFLFDDDLKVSFTLRSEDVGKDLIFMLKGTCAPWTTVPWTFHMSMDKVRAVGVKDSLELGGKMNFFTSIDKNSSNDISHGVLINKDVPQFKKAMIPWFPFQLPKQLKPVKKEICEQAMAFILSRNFSNTVFIPATEVNK